MPKEEQSTEEKQRRGEEHRRRILGNFGVLATFLFKLCSERWKSWKSRGVERSRERRGAEVPKRGAEHRSKEERSSGNSRARRTY